MSTPNPNDPGYTPVDTNPPANPPAEVEPARNNAAMLWILLLVALVALAWWWYGQRPVAEPMTTPAVTGQPAAVEEGNPVSPAADKPAAKRATPKSRENPKPIARISRDPSPLASNQTPKYPPQALRSGVEGSVSVRVEVDASGVPTDVKVVERSGERSRDLDSAVTDTVRKWRFEPAMKDGKAVAGTVVVPVEFKNR